ncbi:hypothetical protein B0H14DRAFT_2391138 [Mycena olivaceomarginata]|nr:hypothetical protein B0H14DRAFT_2391138 [Mycena olivaceomarginata]
MLLALLLFALPRGIFGAVFDLAGLDWTLLNQNGSIHCILTGHCQNAVIAIPATIPSQAHLDLTRAGVITEPLLGINDFTERWVFMDNWTYTVDISPFLESVSDEADQILLVFNGLDTIANIVRHLGRSASK